MDVTDATADDETARRAMKLAKRISKQLSAMPMVLQGATLADLVAMFLVRFPMPIRADILEAHVKTVIGMMPVRDPDKQKLAEPGSNDAKLKPKVLN